MSNSHQIAAPQNRIRQLISTIAAFGVAASIVFVGAPASAADVDLVVNVSTAQSVYGAEDIATYTVRVDNRGSVNTTVPATVTLAVPNTRNTSTAWEQSATCTAFDGAVCPVTSFTRAGETISASIPSIPVAGYVVFTVQAPGEPSNFVRGPVTVTATVAPQAGDADIELATDESFITVLISAPDIRYSTSATGPSVATAVSSVSYDVVIANDGAKNSVFSSLALAAGAGTGTATATPVLDFGFTDVQCIAETVAGLCANLRAINSADDVIQPQPSPILTPGVTALFGVIDMPAASSVTLRFTVNTGRPACNNTVDAALRTLTLSDTVNPIDPSGLNEPASQNANNSASVITNLPAPACAVGDIATQTLTQPGPQGAAGVAAGGTFSYTATYSNLSGSPAVGAEPEFSALWPGGAGTVVDATPTCTASGAAVCPTSWQAAGATVRGQGAQLPVGGVLTVTYTGTAGTDNTTICRPLTMLANTVIVPPLAFRDTNYNPAQNYVTNAQSKGNNARQISTQANIGSPCTESHDDAVQQSGPFTDAAATIPLSGPAVPGQVLYFRTVFTSIETAPPFNTYSAAGSVTVPSNDVLDVGDDHRWFRSHAGDPAGLPYRDDDYSFILPTVPFDTGVRCIATDGATCPTQIGSALGSNGGGGARWIQGWSTYWKPGTQPAMPAGSTLSFISSYKIADLDPFFEGATCIPNGYDWGAGPDSGTATTMNITAGSYVSATTNPASSDRNIADDSTSTVFPVQIARCTNTLEVTKKALTEDMPVDRLVEYEITVTNSSGGVLDLPRVIDWFQDDAPATISCTSTTLNAVCPDFPIAEDVRYFGDGSTGPVTWRYSSDYPPAQFDFSWGEPGEPTMPAGSSVTFTVEVQYPETYTGSPYNMVLFGADPDASNGPWPTVGASASVDVEYGSDLAISKSVSNPAPRPGEVVTFTVDVVNAGATVPVAYLTDAMNTLLTPTNPAGFGDLTCRPLTEDDGVLRPETTVGSTACPAFISAASGITGTIIQFAANSGLRLTYTVVAPLTSASIPNLATLTQSNSAVTVGDSASKVNFLTMVTRVSGTIWNDANGSAAGGLSGINDAGENPTNAGGLNAVLVDSVTGNVIAVVPVNADGTYLFPSVPVLVDVTVVLTTTSPAVGGPVGIPALPSGWVATSPLEQVTFGTGTLPVIDKDFGIQRPPTTDDKTDPVVPNPGGDVRVQVPTFTGNDAEDGPLSTTNTFVIVTLPTYGTLYYNGELVTAGQVITNYDPTLLVVDPAPGAVTVVFTVAAVDAAGAVDATPATITMPFSTPDAASISGAVWYDENRNGVRDSGEVGIEGVTVTLTGVDESGASVTLTTTTDSSGAWSFPNLAPGTYSVRQTQPAGYLTGTDLLGTGASTGGVVGVNEFTEIVLVGGDAAITYNFGEVREAPVDPVDPVDPVGPVTPVAPAVPGTPTQVLGATGLDSTAFVGLAGVLMLLGAAALGVAIRRQDRKSV